VAAKGRAKPTAHFELDVELRIYGCDAISRQKISELTRKRSGVE
jgi:hypothetical protein